jgi:hypothetical protein
MRDRKPSPHMKLFYNYREDEGPGNPPLTVKLFHKYREDEGQETLPSQ